MSNTEALTTSTGHVVGATYRSRYWGGTYKVIGPAETPYGPGVEVECVEPGGGGHNRPGERWTHCTPLDPRDTRISYGQAPGQPFDQADFDAFRADPKRQALVERILGDES